MSNLGPQIELTTVLFLFLQIFVCAYVCVCYQVMSMAFLVLSEALDKCKGFREHLSLFLGVRNLLMCVLKCVTYK